MLQWQSHASLRQSVGHGNRSGCFYFFCRITLRLWRISFIPVLWQLESSKVISASRTRFSDVLMWVVPDLKGENGSQHLMKSQQYSFLYPQMGLIKCYMKMVGQIDWKKVPTYFRPLWTTNFSKLLSSWFFSLRPTSYWRRYSTRTSEIISRTFLETHTIWTMWNSSSARCLSHDVLAIAPPGC